MSTLVERLEELADIAESEVSETHPYTASLMATAMREAAAALERQGEAVEIMAELTDPDECWYDHHGYCQAHYWMDPSPCPHLRAKNLLAALAERMDGDSK